MTIANRRRNHLPIAVGLSLVALLMGLLVMQFPDYIVAAGTQARIDSSNLLRDYLQALGWGLVLFVPILLIPANRQERKALLLLWLIKLLVITLGVMLPYEQIYCADACAYHTLGVHLHQWWPKDSHRFGAPGFGNGSANMVVFAGWHAQLISQSFHVMKVTWSLFGFFAIYLFYRAATLYLGKRDVRVLYLLALFPGIIFWSSIFGKDPLVLLGIAGYTLGVVGWFRQHRLRWIILLLAGLLFAASMRIWLGAIFLLPLILLALRDASWLWRMAIGALAIIAFGYAFSLSLDKFKIASQEDAVQRSGAIAQSWAHGGSAQHIQGGLNSTSEILKFLPVGAFSALFRPLPGEVPSVFGILASVENLILLWLLGTCIFRGRWRRLKNDPLLLWAALLVVTWASIYGIASYQNLGTAVRFKLQIEPILLLLLVQLARRTPAFVPAHARKASLPSSAAALRPLFASGQDQELVHANPPPEP